MRKSVLVFVVFLLCLASFFLFSKYNSSEFVKNVTVTITDQGFYPKKVEIENGTVLTWVNKGEHSHWPASNPHPIHTLYPTSGGCIGSVLDACKGLKPGESFSFTFGTVGTWPMHDHLFPGLVMIVEVSGKKSFLSKLFSSNSTKIPSASNFRKLDYAKQLEIIEGLTKENPKIAWEYLKKAFLVNGEVVGNAHEFAHIIGNSSYQKFGFNGVKTCDATFAYGCFHGVTEEMLLKEGLGSLVSIQNGCLSAFPPNISNNYTGCIHGSGHGAYSFENGDVKKALSDCDSIDAKYRMYCHDGVFMENASSPSGMKFDPNNPWKFCNDFPEDYHRSCARYQSQIFFNNASPTDYVLFVGKNCAKGGSILMKETCYESLGYHVAQKILSDSEKISKSCSVIEEKNGKELCIKGAATEIVFQKYKNSETESLKLCESLTEPRKSLCKGGIDDLIKTNENK